MPVHPGNLTSAYRRIWPEANYTGHDWDDVLGMYYAKARFYDPAAKRFVAMDPVKGNVVDPLSLVSYLYCEDNPLKYVDPMGLMNYFTQTDDLLAGVGRGIYDSTIGAIINIPATGSMLVELVKGFVGGDIDFSGLIKILFDTTLGDYCTVVKNIDTLSPFSVKTNNEVYEYGRAVGAVATDIVMTLVGGKVIDAAIDFLKQTKVGQKVLDLVEDFTKHADDVADAKTGSSSKAQSTDISAGKSSDASSGGKSYFDDVGCLEEQSAKTQGVVDDLKRIQVKDTIGARYPRPDTKPLLQKFADMANEKLNKAGYKSGSVAGTKKHTEFKQLIDEYVKDMDDPYLKTEVSVRRDGSTYQGYPYEPDTIRLDVVEYGPNGNIVAN